MKISYNWLKEHIKFEKEKDIDEISEILTDIGLEVEKAEKIENIKGGLEGIVVGEVLECEKHPNADRLKVTKTKVGDETLQIVCGAPNVDKGQKVLVATVGTTLYTKEGDSFKIKKGKIRGEESKGMICAEDELGLGEGHDGIMVLDTDKPSGTLAKELFEIKQDYTIEIGLTPNRADAMSHYGVARDLYAYYKYKGENVKLERKNIELDLKGNDIIDIKVDENLSPKYLGLIIKNIKVESSPEWIKERLKSIDIIPKNNIVDITNYILHDLGQPLHAFDLDKLKGNEINVRGAEEGEKITALDEKEYTIKKGDLIIYDKESPVCFGGVMGGLNSGVSESTKNIFLECAYFDPIKIRKTAKNHGFNTDASFRFERGIDPNKIEENLHIAGSLIKKISGGEITSKILGKKGEVISNFKIDLSYKKTINLIGKEISKDEIKTILNSLDIKIEKEEEDIFKLLVPPYRVDVQRDVDIIEEILRIYGFNNVEPSQRMVIPIVTEKKVDKNFKIKNEISKHLVSLGLNEIMNNSLINEKYNSITNTTDEKNLVRMKNPLSKELSVMRNSLLYGGLESINLNINHKNKDLKFFEIGKTYLKIEDNFIENEILSFFITGNIIKENWDTKPKKSDFFYLKGIIENLFLKYGIKYSQKTLDSNIFSEGISFYIKKKKLADIGVIKENITKKFKIKQEVLYSEINLELLLENIRNKKNTQIKEIPKFPNVRRDLALVLDKNISYKDLYNTAFELEKTLLKEVNLFDIYIGDKIDNNKKSYAMSFILQDEEKTLSEEEINNCINKIQKGLEKKFNATLR